MYDSSQLTDHKAVLDCLRSLNWADLDEVGITAVALAYYFFSVQFRENLEIARDLYPADPMLRRLAQEEFATDNLSPWPGVAAVGEKLDHDEFMRRLLVLSPISQEVRCAVEEFGRAYLARVRTIDPVTRAASIASYEDGGLEGVFRSMLQCRYWHTPLLQAFKHFLTRHIAFDSDPDGHGALARHLKATQEVRSLWIEFSQLLTNSAPNLKRI